MLQTVLDHLDKIVRPAIRDYVAAEEALDTAHAANDPAATPALDPPTRGQARRYSGILATAGRIHRLA
jgi:hypothetical protein